MRAFIFDTETTGLLLPSVAPLAKQPRIIELGLLAVSLEGEIAELSQLINPGIKLPEVITKITGITDAQLKDQPTFDEFYPTLREFFEGGEDEWEVANFLVCHNAHFDVTMLKNELLRIGDEANDTFPWPADNICTVQEYTAFMGKRPKLTMLYETIMGKPLAQTHRALDDARAVNEILVEDGFWTKMGVLS